MRIVGGVLCLVAVQFLAGEVSRQQSAVGLDPDATYPNITRRVEPQYSTEALEAGVQGTVVIELVVSEAGRAVNLSVLSPLGFGLDEKALEAISKWRFEPGRKGGKPVNVAATVEVNFRLLGRPFDKRIEERRTRFNVALRELQQQSGDRRNRAVKTLQELSEQNFAPAMYVHGKLIEAGDTVARDPERAAQLIRKAADGKYAPALFSVGLDFYQRRQNPGDVEEGLRLLSDAATRGSYEAQSFLGNIYDLGLDGLADPDRARRYFAMCAAKGRADCQVRLGKSLLALRDSQERQYLQAIAWLQLAANQGNTEARELVERETPHLTPEQAAWVKRLTSQLVPKQ